MAKRIAKGVVVTTDTKPAVCAFCGRRAELRPYGPNHENICFDCGMADEDTTARMFRGVLEGEDV